MFIRFLQDFFFFVVVVKKKEGKDLRALKTSEKCTGFSTEKDQSLQTWQWVPLSVVILKSSAI